MLANIAADIAADFTYGRQQTNWDSLDFGTDGGSGDFME